MQWNSEDSLVESLHSWVSFMKISMHDIVSPLSFGTREGKCKTQNRDKESQLLSTFSHENLRILNLSQSCAIFSPTFQLSLEFTHEKLLESLSFVILSISTLRRFNFQEYAKFDTSLQQVLRHSDSVRRSSAQFGCSVWSRYRDETIKSFINKRSVL